MFCTLIDCDINLKNMFDCEIQEIHWREKAFNIMNNCLHVSSFEAIIIISYKILSTSRLMEDDMEEVSHYRCHGT